jgi:sarcosine oxidase
VNDAEIIVVGAGVMGLATGRALVAASRNVLLLEQFHVGHARGSSHGTTRVFRLSYPDPAWVRLAQEALPLWRALEAEAGETLFTNIGALDLAVDLVERRRALVSCGVPFEILSGKEVERRYALSVQPDVKALFQPDSGVLHAERARRFLLASATARGLRLLEGTKALELQVGPDHVQVETSAGAFRARAAIVTAGAWARGLLEPVGIDLRTHPTRESVGYFCLAENRPRPVILDWTAPQLTLAAPFSRGRLVYALPASDLAVKVGLDRSGPPTDPDEEGHADTEVVRCLADWLTRCCGVEAPTLVGAETCLYTNTGDRRFRLERVGRLIVGAACDGHGFKFAPLIGLKLAALAAEAAA